MNPIHVSGRPISSSRLATARLVNAIVAARRPQAAPPTSRLSALRRMSGAGDTGGSLQGGTTDLPAVADLSASSQVIVVNAPSGLNLRSQPSQGSSSLAVEPNGTVLIVVGSEQAGWLNVQDPNGRTGWCYTGYLADASTYLGGGGDGTTATAQGQSATPSALGGSGVASSAASSGVLGVIVLGAAVVGAYWLLIK